MDENLKKRILFVDDEPMVLKGLQRTLRKMRHRWDMSFSSSGADALELLDKHPVDVIVSDLKMPAMDGTQLLNEVKKCHPDVVRIILSGHLEHEMTLKSIQIAHQSLSKPCDARVLQQTLAKLFALRDILSDAAIKKIVAQIESLPSLPSIYTEIITEMQTDDPSIKKVGEIVARDLSMTAKILQVVNSAFFGLPHKISSPQQAVMLLGLETIKSLVLSVKIFAQFSQKNFSWFDIDTLFNHSVSVSTCAKAIVTAEKMEQSMISNALMAGLLHDLGKLILATNFQKPYRQLLAEAQTGGQNLWELEYETFGTSHAEIGAYLMGLWSMETPIIEAIAFHHCPARSMAQTMGLLTAVHVGNAIDHENPSAADQEADWQFDAQYLESVGASDRTAPWRQACQQMTERNAQ